MTKEYFPEWLKHGIVGGLVSAITGPKLEEYIDQHKELLKEEKSTLKATITGIGSGAVIGYFCSEKIAKENSEDQTSKKIIGTLAGASFGGLTGYILREYFLTKKQ